MINTDSRSAFSHFFDTALNPEQKQVVAPESGVLLVCAGAGSGKTRVITSRIAHLVLEHNVPAHSILALTFTNKAAREMKERVHSFLGQTPHLPYVGTFHSYCLRLLKSNPHLLPFGVFSLIDSDDQEKIVRALLTKNGLNKKIAPKQVISFISRVKNDALNAVEREELYSQDRIFRDLYFAYENEKNIAHCLDFDDLLTYTLALFEKSPNFKQAFQQNIRHVLVDEYQDTNRVQHALLKAITQDSAGRFTLDSLCVVGDEDQSIYSWRGATVSNIINFKHDFPAAFSITIEQNYRSVQPILLTANHVIQHNHYRNPKKLWSQKEAFDRIRLLSCSSGYQEGEVIALFLKQALGNGKTLDHHALLYRSHFQSRSLEEALIRHGVPYKIMGGIQFYDRQEIKDLLCYLKLVVNPFDRIAFARVINTPSRGLGDKFEQLFNETWQSQPFLDFKEVAQQLIDTKQLTKIKDDALKSFLAVFTGLTAQSKASDTVNAVIARTGYFSYLKSSFEKDEAETKKDNVKELINGIAYFEENTQQTLDIFLQEVALLQEQMASKDENATDYVRLMTLHAAKGLEFDTVVLTGLEESVLPSAHSLYQPETLEEERRLLYVGITRAEERLLITHTRSRYTYGQLTEQRPSRFLDELNYEYVQKEECHYWNSAQFSQYFKEWFTQPKKVVSQAKKVETPQLKPKASTNKWQQHDIVTHTSFGQGVIEKVEQKSEGKVHLTIRFKIGIKKLDADFVQLAP
ncbi:UvrD-helicase domain-containing protein [Candidatus Dependentiae bacterium]|nr:UvrD-helicase domain-containing protein [Candidatus Dependentiae bacterium]